MAGSDSIEFFANYNGWVESRNLEVSDSTNPAEIAHELASVRSLVSDKAFEVLGIDTKTLDAYAKKFASSFAKNDYKSLAAAYKALGSADADSNITKAAKNSDQLKPFAKVYLLRAAAKELNLMWYVSEESKVFTSKSKPKKTGSAPYSGIAFMAKYKDWVAIKKLSIADDTKAEEVAAQLSSIRMTTERKLPQILGIDADSLDAYAAESTNNMRKSFANMEKIVDILCTSKTKEVITKAIPSEAVRAVAVIYLSNKMYQDIKLELEVSPELLMDMFPGLKIPKPKGRMPGQKKKQKK